MAILDTDLLSEIQQQLEEDVNAGASWSSGQWTTPEVLSYMNYRQWRFMKETGILLKPATISSLPNITTHPLPPDWISTQRIAWTSAADEIPRQVPRMDGWEADHGLPTWPYNQASKPYGYTDGESPTLIFESFPGANEAGTFTVYYSYRGTELDGTGVPLTVPIEFAPAIKWGTISDMLGKVGRAHDPGRAQYAEQRFEEAVQAATIMLNGWQ